MSMFPCGMLELCPGLTSEDDCRRCHHAQEGERYFDEKWFGPKFHEMERERVKREKAESEKEVAR